MRRKRTTCPECGGCGLTDNHVTGEVFCSYCDGTGQALPQIVDTTDKLHQILGEALNQQFRKTEV